VSACAIEDLLGSVLARLLPDETAPMDHLKRAELQRDRIVLAIPAKLAGTIEARLAEGETIARDPDNRTTCRLTLPIMIGTRGARATITTGAAPTARQDRSLIAALRRAHILYSRDLHGPMLASAPPSQYARRLAGLALLAPAIQRDILAGKQPLRLTLATLMATELPLDWDQQRVTLGWPA
jgi:site-specific DNA recombinase